ncbi:MAG: hypothetical protein ACKVP3_26175 [Hyphomicrobiaceae bacterium]
MSIDQDRLSVERERLEVERMRLAVEERRVNVEQDRLRYEPTRLQYEAESRLSVVSYEAVMKFSDITIRSLLILNGGAALAVLTFASNTAKTGSNTALAAAVFYFGIGAALSVATSALSYLGQSCFTQNWNRSGYAFQIAAILFGATSLGLFAWGMLDASHRLGMGGSA